MGCFSYTCHLSGLPITYGTRCAIIPLLSKKHFGENSEENLSKFGRSVFVTNDGPNAFFNEFSYPIFGEYNDYGGIENIEEDDNTKCLEEYFELTIDEICQVLCDGRKDEFFKGSEFSDSVQILNKENPKHLMLLKMSAVWFHGDFYDKISTKKAEESDYGKLDIGVPGLLRKLGFKFNGKVQKERFNQEFEKDGLKIYSDGNWINVTKESIYTLPDLKRYCKQEGVNIDIDSIKTLSYEGQIYECILPETEDLENRVDRWEAERVATLLLRDRHSMGRKTSSVDFEITILKILIKRKESGEKELESNDPVYSFLSRIGDSFSGKSLEELKETLSKLKKQDEEEKSKIPNESITEFYFRKIKEKGNNFLLKNIVAWFNVKSYYYSTGRYFYPIGMSPQCGDRPGVKFLLESALEVITQEIKERGEDHEEDENEEEGD